MPEPAGIDPPPRKWVGGSFPRPRAREFCLPAPDHPQSGLLGFGVSTPQPPIKGGFCFSTRGKSRTTAGCVKRKCASVFSRPHELYEPCSFIEKALVSLYGPDGPCGLYGPCGEPPRGTPALESRKPSRGTLALQGLRVYGTSRASWA